MRVCTYIHEVGEPLYGQLIGWEALRRPAAAASGSRQGQQLLHRLAVVANQAAQAPGFVQGNSANCNEINATSVHRLRHKSAHVSVARACNIASRPNERKEGRKEGGASGVRGTQSILL